MDFPVSRQNISLLATSNFIIPTTSETSPQSVETSEINQAIHLIQSNQPDQAFSILKSLADGNNSDVQNLLGDMYFCGIGTEQNFLAAAEYYEKAAGNSNASSSNNLGYAFQYGLKEGQKLGSNPHEAMTHYIQALITTARANRQNTDFVERILQNLMTKQEFAVEIYDSNEHMTPHSYFLQISGSYEFSNTPDLLTAFAIIKNACLLKGGKPAAADVQALNELQGKILTSAQQDLKNGHYLDAYKKLFFLAKDSDVTEANQSTALRFLGKMYCQGLGVTQDIKQAINYLNLPAKQGDAKACFLLGEIYSADTKHLDYEEANFWQQKAETLDIKKNTDLNLTLIMDSLIQHLKDPENTQYATAINDFISSQDVPGKGHYLIGQLYLNNDHGIPTDPKNAEAYFIFSAKMHSYPDASVALQNCREQAKAQRIEQKTPEKNQPQEKITVQQNEQNEPETPQSDHEWEEKFSAFSEGASGFMSAIGDFFNPDPNKKWKTPFFTHPTFEAHNDL